MAIKVVSNSTIAQFEMNEFSVIINIDVLNYYMTFVICENL